MEVYEYPRGRAGNALFRYFASVIMSIIYGARRTGIYDHHVKILDDTWFLSFQTMVLQGHIPDLEGVKYMLEGYYQHDAIYVKFKDDIIKWIKSHPFDLLTEEPTGQFLIRDVLTIFPIQTSDVVVHIRLEDFIMNGSVIHPDSIRNLLQSENINDFCMVVNQPCTELEYKYVDYFRKFFRFKIQSGTIWEDFYVMRNATTLICSCSTLSWAASLLSDTVSKVYMPDYSKHRTRLHETFKFPINDTVTYQYKEISKDSLTDFLGERDKHLMLNTCIIPKFFEMKSVKTSHETLYNSMETNSVISGYVPTNSIKCFYTHICYHTMKKSLECLLENNLSEYLVVETGCSTYQGTKSTTLWDKFVNTYGGHVYSVDLDSRAVITANNSTSDKTLVICSDSVEYLKKFDKAIDFLYLDSYDVDFSNPLPSAKHHLNEFNAVKHLLHKGSVVLIDDTPVSADWYDDACSIPQNDSRRHNFSSQMSGKGSLVIMELEKMNATNILHQYQTLWVI